ARAQLFSPESLNGAFWGSLIGGIAGGDCRHGFSGEGAAIGAGVGLLAGAVAGEVRRYDYYNSPSYVYSTAPSVSFGYGYGNCGSSAYVYYAPNSYCAPGYYYRSTRPNYAVNGTVLGATSGVKQTVPAPMAQDLRNQITSKPCPTSTYTWTARPQIPDAPRVPD